eukprot:766239-Hanusia_phi.AAC.4
MGAQASKVQGSTFLPELCCLERATRTETLQTPKASVRRAYTGIKQAGFERVQLSDRTRQHDNSGSDSSARSEDTFTPIYSNVVFVPVPSKFDDHGSSRGASSNISSPLSQDSTRQNSAIGMSIPSSPDKFGVKRAGTKSENISDEVDELTNRLAVRGGVEHGTTRH